MPRWSRRIFILALLALPVSVTPSAREQREPALNEVQRPIRTAAIADALVGARLENKRGLTLNIAVGAQTVQRLRNPRGLTMILGSTPQALKASTAKPRAGVGAHWMNYGK